MGVEGKEHKLLKLEIKELLLREGFKDSDIYFEKKMIIGDKKIIADVYAENSKNSIVIECGKLPLEKLSILKQSKVNFLVFP